MGYLAIGWAVVAALVPALIGTGIGVLSLSPAEFELARNCFIASAVILGLATLGWQSITKHSAVYRVIVTFVIGGTIAAILPEALRWVAERERAAQAPQAATPVVASAAGVPVVAIPYVGIPEKARHLARPDRDGLAEVLSSINRLRVRSERIVQAANGVMTDVNNDVVRRTTSANVLARKTTLSDLSQESRALADAFGAGLEDWSHYAEFSNFVVMGDGDPPQSLFNHFATACDGLYAQIERWDRVGGILSEKAGLDNDQSQDLIMPAVDLLNARSSMLRAWLVQFDSRLREMNAALRDPAK